MNMTAHLRRSSDRRGNVFQEFETTCNAMSAASLCFIERLWVLESGHAVSSRGLLAGCAIVSFR
jgi:hypothetical protein